MREKITKYIKKLAREQEKLSSELKKWVRKDEIPLSERWEIFLLSEMGDHHSLVVHFDSLKAVKAPTLSVADKQYTLEDYIYNNYVERYQVISVAALEEWINEIVVFGDENGNFTVKEQDLAAFKREVLEKYIKSFELDW